MALQGTIESFALADVMRLLGSSSKTGRLIVNGDRGSADLWFASGALVGGDSSTQPGAAEVAEVVFDILRYRSGSFTFEADSTNDVPGDPEAVDAIIGQAEDALAEWGEIVAVVPSLESWLTLAPELLHPEVVVDQACWTAIVTVGGGTTVRQMGSRLGLGELPSSRLVRALVQAGFVEVGSPRTDVGPVAAPVAFDAVPATDAASGSDLPPAAPELPTRHPQHLDVPVASFDADGADGVAGFDPFDTVDAIHTSASFDAPVDLSSDTSALDPSFAVDGSFDSNGTAHDLGADGAPAPALDPFGSPEDGVALPSLTISGLTDDPFADGSFGHEGASDGASDSAWAGVLVEPEVPTDPPDVARSMSMLSDRAAQALASVVAKEAGPTVVAEGEREAGDLDDERARMLRFLGSV